MTFALSRVMSAEDFRNTLLPDIVITLNSGYLSYIRSHLKSCKGLFEHWGVNAEGKLQDPVFSLKEVFEAAPITFLKKMVESGRYLFIKDTCCSIVKLKEKLDIINGSSVMLFNANGATLYETIKMGAHGYSGVMANFHPELYVKLLKAHEEGNTEKAEFLANMVGFFSLTECQCYPVNAKYYVSLDGVNIGINTRTRNPAELFESRKLEIEQMYKFTEEIKTKYAL
jgi:hypothetical protein